jgi:hypothetical protein
MSAEVLEVACGAFRREVFRSQIVHLSENRIFHSFLSPADPKVTNAIVICGCQASVSNDLAL